MRFACLAARGICLVKFFLVSLLLTSASSFAALASVAAAPRFASVHTGQRQQFTADGVSGASKVIWAVNGIPGGNASVGTITSSGLYTAPAGVPAGVAVMVTVSVSGMETTLATAAITTGLDFYVSAAGKDSNPGTLELPWRTIQHAANMAIAGDTVFVRGGTYHELVNIAGAGSASAGALVFRSYPGEHAVLDGTGVSWPGGPLRGLFTLLGAHSDVIIEGFEIQNFTAGSVADVPAGVVFIGSGTGFQLLNNTIHGISRPSSAAGNAFGVVISGNVTTAISNVTVSGNQIYGLELGRGESLLFDGNVDGFTATGNIIHDSDNIGIDAAGFYGSGPNPYDQARNGDISQNTIYNQSSFLNPSYLRYSADGVYCDGCGHVVIERNQIYACDQNIGASSENPGRFSSFVTIRNNVLYDANMNAISIGGFPGGGGSESVTIVNNTILHNTHLGWGNGIEIGDLVVAGVIENNIIDATVPGALLMNPFDSTASTLTLDHNVYHGASAILDWVYQGVTYGSLAAYQQATGQEQHSRFISPALLSVEDPYDLDLEPSSPAHGAGNYSLGMTDFGNVDFAGNPRTTGATISIGAYQK
jgi:hypothetical protein